MREHIHEAGRWWIPGHEETIIFGSFDYETGSHIRLTLHGEFPTSSVDIDFYEEIYGISSSGKCIVTQNCQRTSFQWAGGGTTVTWRVEVAFSSNSEEIFNHHTASKLWVQFSHFSNWSGASIFSIQPIKNQETGAYNGTNIRIDAPSSIDLSTCQDWSWSILLNYDQIPVRSYEELQTICINQATQLEIRFNEPTPFAVSHPSIHLFRSFLSLATQHAANIIAMSGENGRGAYFSIYHQQMHPYSREDEARQYDMLFLRHEIPNTQAALRNWSEKREALGTIYDLYTSHIFLPEVTIETKFLWAIQACDSYIYYRHRKLGRRGKTNIETGLTELITLHCNIIDLTAADIESFAKRAALARHYYSHRDQTQRNRVAQGIELIQITRKIRELLEVILLEEIGIPLNHINDIIVRRRRTS